MQSNFSFRPSSIIMEVDSSAINTEFARKETDEELKIVLSAQNVMGELENGQFDINVEHEEFLDEGNSEALQNELGETIKSFTTNEAEVSKDSIVDENIIDLEANNEEQPQNKDIETESEINMPFGCFGCNASFKRKGLLKRHVETEHGNETPFQCSICPSKFGKKSHLVQHTEIVHEEKKAFQCTLCQTNYETIEYLKQHVAKVHEKKKSFDCSICQSKFALKGELKSHKLKQHYENHRKFKFGNKFYKCSFCSVDYASEGYLNWHVYKCHTIKCPICPSRFDESCNLQKHIDLIHSEKLQPQVLITRINIKPDKIEGLSKNAEPT